LSRFLPWVETRPDAAVLADPVLSHLEPRDLSVPTFALIYGGLALAVALLARRPRDLTLALRGYAILTTFRIVLMWVTPLEEPPGAIPLHDPVVESFGPGQVLTRDLFFSGHTSTLFLLALAVRQRWARALLLAATALVVTLVLWQHVHYTVDVLVAPFVAWAAYEIGRRSLATGW
jgi:membrane-associated phospholipid phosphatase